MDRDDLRIGLALGGGGAAALSYIGVLEQLVEAGVPVHCVAGTSAGAIVGAAFAAGHLAELREALVTLKRRRFFSLFDFCWSRSGLLQGRRGMELIAPAIGSADIETLPLRFAAVATDIHTGEEVVLDRGPVAEAVRASLAIPGVFRPHTIGGRVLVDGGLSNPVPVSVARRMGADFVLAISVLPLRKRARPQELLRAPEAADEQRLACEFQAPSLGLFDVLAKGSAVIQCHIAAARLRDDPPDELLVPDTQGIGVFSLLRSAEAVEAGREVARRRLPTLLASIERAKQRLGSPLRRWFASPLARPGTI